MNKRVRIKSLSLPYPTLSCRLELKSAMDELSTQQVASIANRMLEADDTLPDEETKAAFVGPSTVAEGSTVSMCPCGTRRQKEALEVSLGARLDD